MSIGYHFLNLQGLISPRGTWYEAKDISNGSKILLHILRALIFSPSKFWFDSGLLKALQQCCAESTAETQGKVSDAFLSSEQAALIKLTCTFSFLGITLTGVCSSQHSGLIMKNFQSLMEKCQSFTVYSWNERIVDFQVVWAIERNNLYIWDIFNLYFNLYF